MDFDVESRKGLERSCRDPQPSKLTSGEYDDLRPMVQELLNVGELDAWRVPGAGLAPIPFARSAREELDVLEATAVVEVDFTPAEPRDFW